MTEYRIEPGEGAHPLTCATCGGRSWQAHGFVYEDEAPRGIYYLEWCEGEHPDIDRRVWVALSLGDFGDESTAGDRSSYGLEWGPAGMMLTDAPVHDRPDQLGEFVPSTDAPTTTLRAVAERISVYDPLAVALKSWVEGGESPVSKA